MSNSVNISDPNHFAKVEVYEPAANDDGLRVLVIGSGPAGVRFAHEFLKRQPNSRLTLFGDEPHQPYNRVQLSALLAGEVQYDDILTPLPNALKYSSFTQANVRIEKIDLEEKCIFDSKGVQYAYDKLVFATGSRPHIPNIPGVDQTGVYTFRNLKDAESLYNRLARARHIVVVGGGLLGLEAARALLRFNTLVTVIQQGPRIMNRQLDEEAADCLLAKIETLGIKVITNSGARKILGDGRVTGVVTRDGDKIVCDTVLLCAGIKPNVELARNSRIKVSSGILVDDRLATSAPDVYAIGECCEHRGKTYGLVNPGFEQAAIAAEVLAGGPSQYIGSLEISRLKVVGETVCSMGEVADTLNRPRVLEWVFRNKRDGIYRKIVTHRGKLIGAVGFGEWPEIRRIQEAFQYQRTIFPWQFLRFKLSGSLWGTSDDDNVAFWPAPTVVCQCNNITQGQLVEAQQCGATTVAELVKATSAGSTCGSCKGLLANLLGETVQREKIKAWWPATLLTILALATTLLIAVLPPISVSQTVEQKAFLQGLWDDKLWKQITGFTLLGLSAVGLLMSLKKRIKSVRFGDFAYWRLLHIALGTLCALLLIAHTGFSLGQNLNQLLILDFLAVIILGCIAAVVLSINHKLSAGRARSLKHFWTWGHILVVWPLPILLAIHIITVYYF